MKCSICIRKIKNTEDLHKTSCAHTFHINCMNQLVSYNTKQKLDVLCPNCRTVLIKYIEQPPQHIEIQIDTTVPQIIIENEEHEIIHKKIMNLYISFGIVTILMYILYYFRHFLQFSAHIPPHK